jgi:PadR family transcriptional regulator PadR
MQGTVRYTVAVMDDGTDRRDFLSQARRGVLELCVLALIAREPHYGYQLTTQLAALGKPLAAPEGTLYPLLRRLQRDALVSASWQESRDGPPRKYYHLTHAGQHLLAEQLAEWDELTRAVAELRQAPATNDARRAPASNSDTADKEVPDGTGSRSQPPPLPRSAPAPAGAPATS